MRPTVSPSYADLILENIVDLKEDGSFWLDQSYFNYATGLTMTSRKFHDLFGGPPRDPETPLTQRHMDLAASVQKVTEEIMLRITRNLATTYQIENLCLAGGVALNCVANGKVLRDGSFKRIWIQPAAGDAGGAVGAALAAYHQHLGRARRTNGALDGMQGSYLGPEFSQAEIEKRLAAAGAKFTVIDEPELFERTCDALEAGHAVGWFQGRMEFGPRALGARSILGDPRNPEMQKTLNLKVKYRESFRPFAPSVLREDVADYFELDADSPYMLLVADVKRNRRRPMTAEQERLFGIDKLNVARSDIPAVTHVDYSARIQTVHAETNPRYHALLSAFKRRTGCSVLVNTSFNVRGEPIVCTPEDAFRCFMGTEMEIFIAGNCLFEQGGAKCFAAVNYSETSSSISRGKGGGGGGGRGGGERRGRRKGEEGEGGEKGRGEERKRRERGKKRRRRKEKEKGKGGKRRRKGKEEGRRKKEKRGKRGKKEGEERPRQRNQQGKGEREREEGRGREGGERGREEGGRKKGGNEGEKEEKRERKEERKKRKRRKKGEKGKRGPIHAPISARGGGGGGGGGCNCCKCAKVERQ